MTKSDETYNEDKKATNQKLSESELESVAGGVMWNGKGEKIKKEPGKFYPTGVKLPDNK